MDMIAAAASLLLAQKSIMTAGIVGLKASVDAEQQTANMIAGVADAGQQLASSGSRGRVVNLLA